MFAIAAIAAMSFGMTPAFANFSTGWSGLSVDAYDTDNWTKMEIGCGTHAVTTELQISEHSPGNEDVVRVNTDASRCSSHQYSAVTVIIEKNGSEVLNITGFDDEEEFTYPGPLVGGDIIDVSVEYVN